jgi:hypothetical protein
VPVRNEDTNLRFLKLKVFLRSFCCENKAIPEGWPRRKFEQDQVLSLKPYDKDTYFYLWLLLVENPAGAPFVPL